MVLRKFELETKLKDDAQLIRSGVLRNDHPLDLSPEFHDFLQACRRGDLKRCQELISAGVNINAKDQFDYTPLVVASLCGHYELVQLLLESGALADPDSFERERAVYNALNNKIRNLLVSYDYSKTADPLQPWSSHITSLLVRNTPATSDITLSASAENFRLHKFILSARSPYFMRKFAEAPETQTWKLSPAIPVEAFRVVLRYLYLGDLPRDLVGPNSAATEEEVFKGIDRLCKQLELERLWEAVLSINDRRLARQRQQDEVQRAQAQVEALFHNTVLKHKIVVDTRKAGDVKWPHHNAIFADCILRADEQSDQEDDTDAEDLSNGSAIPVGPIATSQPDKARKPPRRSVLFPVHKPFLIRSPYFETMFSSDFLEAQERDHLHIIKVDCSPQVLEIILRFLYTEKADCPLEHALDLLYAADMLLLEKLKTKAAITISTLGSGTSNALVDRTHNSHPNASGGSNAGQPLPSSTNDDDEQPRDGGSADADAVEVEPINVYDVIHAAWDLKVQRLEEFAARYLAGRLEDYIDEDEFAELIRESAARLRERQETDTIELLDDIRYYLSERFRLRFEGEGLEEMLDEGADAVVAGEGGGEGQPVGKNGEDVKVVEDEFASDAVNYQILLEKIDRMLEKLKLDA
ncbi:e0245003-c233-4fa8-8b57-b34b306ccb5b [Thermothielavioides terrestris]|uniref:E0245003-c233-4fa8-8b57-b34b306ccb5b n=1 Tax=Thermothielavioides terrestris TaxID=2587410 RepID=A0A3S4AK83_9PEZI|nr:e0245003-c233-4fa8-8b57-b34b306ccb5b [Thermothielavioides terrestris]